MPISQKQFLAASLSCLQHDVRVARNSLQFHVLNPFDPFSKAVRDDLCPLVDALELFYKKLDDPAFHNQVIKSL